MIITNSILALIVCLLYAAKIQGRSFNAPISSPLRAFSEKQDDKSRSNNNKKRAQQPLKDIVVLASAATAAVSDQLTYVQTMTAGAISRTIAQTFMHPANTYKTLLQLKDSKRITSKLTPERLLRGVDAQFLLSLPHGAFHFFVIDQVCLPFYFLNWCNLSHTFGFI